MSSQWAQYLAFGASKKFEESTAAVKSFVQSENEKQWAKYLTTNIITKERTFDNSSRPAVVSSSGNNNAITFDVYLSRGLTKSSGSTTAVKIPVTTPATSSTPSVSWAKYLTSGIVKTSVPYEDVKRPEIKNKSMVPMLYAHYLANGMTKLDKLPNPTAAVAPSKKSSEITAGAYLTKTVIKDTRNQVSSSLPPVLKSSEPITYSTYLAYGLSKKRDTSTIAGLKSAAEAAVNSSIAAVDAKASIVAASAVATASALSTSSEAAANKTLASAESKASSIATDAKAAAANVADDMTRSIANVETAVSSSLAPTTPVAASSGPSVYLKTDKQKSQDEKIDSFGTRVKNMFSSMFSSSPKK